jgi:hypothetical protein
MWRNNAVGSGGVSNLMKEKRKEEILFGAVYGIWLIYLA